MACNNLVTITKSCDNNQGGIYKIYINDTDNINSISASASTWSITSASASTPFTAFIFKRNVGNVAIEPKIDLVNGSTYYEVKVSLVFHRREGAKSRALNILGEGQRYLDIMFSDANGINWYIDHAQLDGGSEDTGTVKADGSKYTVTFTAQMDHSPYEITAVALASVI